MSFVRKNLLTLSGKFFVPGFCYGHHCPDGSPTPPQPSAVQCVLTYYPPTAQSSFGHEPCKIPPVQMKSALNLTLGLDGVTWSGQWDSSVAEGRVDWVVYSSGSVVAAAQGNFVVRANAANVTVQ